MRGVAEQLQTLHNWGPLDLAKRVKLARSAAVATNQQPKRMPQLVPEFEKVQQVLHVPKDVAISLDSKRNTMQCMVFQCNDAEIFIPCKTRMLRRTPQRGCSSCGGGDQVSNTVSMDLLQASATQSLTQNLVVGRNVVAVKNVKNCNNCTSIVRVDCDQNVEGDEIILGMYWSPEQFLAQVSLAGHPQHLLSGISETMQVAVVS